MLAQLVAHAFVVGALVACASARTRPALPPHMLIGALGIDSARAIVLTSLAAEQLAVDGTPALDANVVSSTFTVRRGGMGEAEIRLRLRLTVDRDVQQDSSGVVLLVEATARDRNRMITMSAEDARSPRLSREPHPVNENDRESLQRIAHLVDRLRQQGFRLIDAR